MRYIVEFDSFANFEAWQGGKDVLNKVKELGRIEELDRFFEEYTGNDGEYLTETQINDFLWFELPECDGWTNLFD